MALIKLIFIADHVRKFTWIKVKTKTVTKIMYGEIENPKTKKIVSKGNKI